MIRKKILALLFLALVLLPFQIHAQGTNAGFVPGNIWYSQDPFEEGDKIKIYTLIFNPDERELSGTVIFFDSSVFLGKKDFTASAKGIKDVSIDWTATVGDHNIFGKIENSRFLVSGEKSERKYEDVYLSGNETSKSSRRVNKKIVSVSSDTIFTNIGLAAENTGNIVGDYLKNTKEAAGVAMKENTPSVVIKPIALAINAVETLRQSLGTSLETKKQEIKSQIKILNTPDSKIVLDTNPKKDISASTADRVIKPFKYTELFALALLSTTFNNKFIFYAVLVLIIFFLLRYILKRVR